MSIELLKLERVLRNSERLDSLLRTWDCSRSDVRDLHELVGRVADPSAAELFVVDDVQDAPPAAKIVPLASDLRRVRLAMWVGGNWDLHVVSEQQEGQTGDQLVEGISDIRWITLSVLKDNGQWDVASVSAIVVNGRLWVDRPQFDVLFASV